MSLPPQVSADKSGKHRAAAMKEPVQHSGEVYYGMGPSALESSHTDSASSSGVYNHEKGPQSLPHYQQAAPVKWLHQDSVQAPGWSQEAPVPAWGQNFGAYMGGVNARGQMAFHKGVHEGVALPMAGENQLPGPVEVYRDVTQAQAQAQAQAQGRGLEWEQHAAAAMHQAQLQAYQHAHKGVELQGQPHVPPHTLQGSMLQPFQTTFRPSKQQFSSGYYSVFPGNKGMQSLAYGEQPKTQQQLLHQMQQQQQMHHHHQQQQQLQQQHHLQLQQQQHLQQQQQHQIQQHQMQQQQLQQMQQQYHQQQIQERQQQIQQMQQQQQQVPQQNVPQQETTPPQVQPKQQQTQHMTFQPPEPGPPDAMPKKEDVQSMEPQQEPEAKGLDASSIPDPCLENVDTNPAEPSDTQLAAPRRSRRLSRDGQSPLGPPSTNIWSQATKEPSAPQNGVAGTQAVKGGEVTTGGVIRRRRRASKEINLETLAQQASVMEPAKMVKQDDGSSGRHTTMVPLVIPVSVPVHKSQTDPQGGWAQGRLGQGERPAGQSDRKPVIVARRRSLRNSMTESFGQEGENDPVLDEDGKSKFKRRPRPQPLIIPPHKPSTFIPPSLYSTITSYQSNLRSPVRMPDNPLTLPPYTPPPILSPVREGSGLYFSTFLTNMAVSNQILPPPPTPKSATRSLLRSSSSEITPPVLPLIADAAPASLEPRINIGLKYQADIPELQDQASSQFDQHKADLVWLPMDESSLKHGDQETMEDLMNMACCSVLRGGGTNQELALHCLHDCGGDFLETLGRLMHQDPVFPKGHRLAGYHYSGSDCWTADEKRYFNKGISAYRKDFFMVQKLVRTKAVAQCVEFYYTYKKQVKIGRNGILTFGPPESPVEKHTEAVVDIKSSQQSKLTQGETDRDDHKDVSYESSHQARVAQSLQVHDYAGTMLVIKEPDTVSKEAPHQPSAPHRPRGEPAAKKPRVPAKPPPDPDAIFPCKKCGRVFYKVKSRSAHMKSHAEQEKKAAALRQKEEEEQAAAEARARKAAAAATAAANQRGDGNGATEQAEVSSQEDSSEGEDDDDEDWH